VAKLEHTRSQDPDFVKHCRFRALQERQPLRNLRKSRYDDIA
jgi:hypothetical protein